jgi:hypothetical protein
VTQLSRKCTHYQRNSQESPSRYEKELNAFKQAEYDKTEFQLRLFTSKRFHALLNSLFKVLCNFPSRYLFAIGIALIFSLRWDLPPTLGCTLKQPDSTAAQTHAMGCRMGLAPSMGGGPPQWDTDCRKARERLALTPQVPTPRRRGIRCWAFPRSFAITRGILVSFFSSPY